jgi:hypothetical protein
MKAKNTHKRPFLRELILLSKRYNLIFTVGYKGECVIHEPNACSAIAGPGTMGVEDFAAWLEDADDYEATELEEKKKEKP